MLEKVDEFYWITESAEWIHDYTNSYHYKPINIVDIAENREPAFRVYPNPASSQITIASSDLEHPTTFTLYDLQGRIILERSCLQPVTIQVSGYNTGIYLYQVSCGNALVTGKILIQ